MISGKLAVGLVVLALFASEGYAFSGNCTWIPFERPPWCMGYYKCDSCGVQCGCVGGSKLSHAQLPRLNVCLAPAQLVPRLDQGSATIAPLIFRTIRITDVLNAFLIMSVNRIITPNRQGQTIANSVS